MSPPSVPMREMCALCGEVNRVGFHVPNGVWAEVVHPSRREDIHCIQCFAKRVDEKLVAWDESIVFHPVSSRSHLLAVGLLREVVPND